MDKYIYFIKKYKDQFLLLLATVVAFSIILSFYFFDNRGALKMMQAILFPLACIRYHFYMKNKYGGKK